MLLLVGKGKNMDKQDLELKATSNIKEFIETRGWKLTELEDCIMINIRSDIFYISYEFIVENGYDKIIQYCKDRSFMYERLAL